MNVLLVIQIKQASKLMGMTADISEHQFILTPSTHAHFKTKKYIIKLRNEKNI